LITFVFQKIQQTKTYKWFSVSLEWDIIAIFFLMRDKANITYSYTSWNQYTTISLRFSPIWLGAVQNLRTMMSRCFSDPKWLKKCLNQVYSLVLQVSCH